MNRGQIDKQGSTRWVPRSFNTNDSVLQLSTLHLRIYQQAKETNLVFMVYRH